MLPSLRRIGPTCLLVGLLAVLPSWSQTQSEGVRGTYVGNEGFLIEGGGRKVLIDGLYYGLGGYVAPTDDQIEIRESGGPPFDGIDLILATHDHGDHFHPESVGRYLLANPTTHFVSSQRAVERMQAYFAEFEQIRDRVRGTYPDEGERSRLEVGGIELEALNLHHGRGRNPPVQNLGFVLQLGGMRILHIGDTEATAADLRPYDLAGESIDIAFIPFWHLLSDTSRQMIATEIAPRWIVPMHVPAVDAPASYFGSPGSFEALVESLSEIPNAVVLRDVLDTHQFTPYRPQNPGPYN